MVINTYLLYFSRTSHQLQSPWLYRKKNWRKILVWKRVWELLHIQRHNCNKKVNLHYIVLIWDRNLKFCLCKYQFGIVVIYFCPPPQLEEWGSSQVSLQTVAQDVILMCWNYLWKQILLFWRKCSLASVYIGWALLVSLYLPVLEEGGVIFAFANAVRVWCGVSWLFLFFEWLCELYAPVNFITSLI